MNAAHSAVGARHVAGSLITCGLACIALLFLSGCPQTPPPAPTGSSTTKKTSTNSAICVDSFERAVGIVQPTNLGVDADPKTAIALINEWVTYCAPADKLDVGLAVVKEKYLSDPVWDNAKSRLENDLFDLRDVRYLRDAYLMRQIGEKLARQADNDRARVNGFFDYVCTNMALDPSLTGSTPHTGFESLLWGLGSPADRVWVFLGILQQMKIEAVVLTFDSVQLQAYQCPYLLVGVPINDQVYLYDPLIGLPLPNQVELPDASAWGQATWAEFKSDEFWKSYEQGKLAHALLNVKAADAKAWLYGSSSSWSARMQEFESLLRGDQVASLFDPLVDIQGKTSLIAQGLPQRVRAGLPEGTLPEFAGVWTYPEMMINASTNPTPEQQQQIAVRMQPFQTASLIIKSSTSQQTGSEDGQHQENKMEHTATSELKYYSARMGQLQQNFSECIPAYVKLSLNVPQTMKTRDDVIRMIMAQDANYWLGLSQFESEDYAIAADSLRRYLDQFGRQGRWFQPALINYCKALAAGGKQKEAVDFISQVTLDSPQIQEAVYLMRRWTPAGDVKKEAAAEPASEKPTTPEEKPAEPAKETMPATTPAETPPASPAPQPTPVTPLPEPVSTTPATEPAVPTTPPAAGGDGT